MTAELKERCEQQLDELELLQSVFSQPGEFTIEDEVALSQARAFLQDLTPSLPPTLSCTVNLTVSPGGEEDCQNTSSRVDVSCRLSQNYPSVPPEVCVRSDSLSRLEQDKMNEDLHTFMLTGLPHGEVCLLSVVEWVRENAAHYIPHPPPMHPAAQRLGVEDKGSADEDQFCRTWLYMHHIYSKTKRRNILSAAADLELTGFCLPGKPGVVCVEGDVRRTKQFYSILRRWNWKSITCRKKEVVAADVQTESKFCNFHELDFDTHGPRSNHMDMGQFRDYLKEHGLEYMFKELFGVN